MSRYFLLFIFCVITPCMGLNILGLFPHPGRSHFDVFEPLLKELSARGHNLTVIGHFPLQNSIPGYTDVSLKGDTEILLNTIDVQELPKPRWAYYYDMILLWTYADQSCKSLQSNKITDFIKTDQKFDLIIIEAFNTDCFLGFAYKYKIPFIGLSSCIVMPWTNARFGNPMNPSYIPLNLLPHSDRMTFLERVENTVYYFYAEFMIRYIIEPSAYTEAKKLFGDDLPPLSEIAKNMSLLLANSHFSLTLPRPFVPNIIEIGGMFLGKPKELPQNLEKYINESPHGVIYFSMGSMIKAQTFSEEKRRAFLDAFAKLKQNVLWKWENETMPDKPKNVMIQPWMPQYDILCHSNVVAFISHGGLLGTTEAVQCGVPIVVMPQFGDQFTNAKAVEAVGAGVILDFQQVTAETVFEKLNTVLQPSFKRQAETVSARFRDRPMSPMDTAIYWVEYVARHGGAHHMKSAAVDLPFYQEMLLDVIAFLVLVSFVILACVYLVIKTIKKMVVGSDKMKTKVH